MARRAAQAYLGGEAHRRKMSDVHAERAQHLLENTHTNTHKLKPKHTVARQRVYLYDPPVSDFKVAGQRGDN